LLAEDDDDLRELIQQFLEERAYRVIPVEDGLELGDYLSLAHENNRVPIPSLILADVNMPGRTSLEVLEQFGRDEGVPIVLISAFADDETRRRAAKIGVTMVLDKPIDPRVLGSVVEALISGNPAKKPRRLLIADDDEQMRAWLALALGSAEGQQVQEAVDGLQLSSALKLEGPFDLVVADLRMPGANGLEVITAARAAGIVTPALIITGFADEATLAEARAQG